MKHSCGALLYTVRNDKIYIVLGKEPYHPRKFSVPHITSTINGGPNDNYLTQNRSKSCNPRGKYTKLHQWFPFKGTCEKGETFEQAAVREIYEETLGLVSCQDIKLVCNFSTKYKNYHIGLVEIKDSFVEEFSAKRDKEKKGSAETHPERFEKSQVEMFSLDDAVKLPWHNITCRIIKFFLNELKEKQKKLQKSKS